MKEEIELIGLVFVCILAICLLAVAILALISMYLDIKQVIKKNKQKPWVTSWQVDLDQYTNFCFSDPGKGECFGSVDMLKWLVRNKAYDYFESGEHKRSSKE